MRRSHGPWLRLRIGGQKWAVHLVRAGSKKLEEDPDETVQGITLLDACRIYLSRGQSDSALEETFLHELLHAAFHVSGASHAIADEAKEETIVRCLTPVLHRLLIDLGFRFPKVNP